MKYQFPMTFTPEVGCRHYGGTHDCTEWCLLMWGERFFTEEEE